MLIILLIILIMLISLSWYNPKQKDVIKLSRNSAVFSHTVLAWEGEKGKGWHSHIHTIPLPSLFQILIIYLTKQIHEYLLCESHCIRFFSIRSLPNTLRREVNTVWDQVFKFSETQIRKYDLTSTHVFWECWDRLFEIDCHRNENSVFIRESFSSQVPVTSTSTTNSSSLLKYKLFSVVISSTYWDIKLSARYKYLQYQAKVIDARGEVMDVHLEEFRDEERTCNRVFSFLDTLFSKPLLPKVQAAYAFSWVGV